MHVDVATDWRPGLVGALDTGVLCPLKVLGVHVSRSALTAVEDAASSLGHLSAWLHGPGREHWEARRGR